MCACVRTSIAWIASRSMLMLGEYTASEYLSVRIPNDTVAGGGGVARRSGLAAGARAVPARRGDRGDRRRARGELPGAGRPREPARRRARRAPDLARGP